MRPPGFCRRRAAEIFPGMKPRTYLLIVLAAVAASGCRSDVHRELLERELRWQEEEIDHMESHVIEYKRRLASLQRENAALREKLAAAQARLEAQQQERERSSRSTRQGRPEPEDEGPPAAERDDRDAPFNGRPERAAPGGGMPEGEPGELPPDDTGELPALEPLPNNNDGNNQPGKPDPAQGSGAAGNASGAPVRAGPSARGSSIERIVLNQQGTHGFDADGRPGDDGIRILIEPRDRQGRIVHVPGELHVELYAPTSEGEIPVARWIFTSDQTALRLSATPEGHGMEYTLRWPADPPPQRQVKLYVRYLTPDGAEATAEHALVVNLAAAAARRAMMGDHRRSRPASGPRAPTRAAAGGERIPRRLP